MGYTRYKIGIQIPFFWEDTLTLGLVRRHAAKITPAAPQKTRRRHAAAAGTCLWRHLPVACQQVLRAVLLRGGGGGATPPPPYPHQGLISTPVPCDQSLPLQWNYTIGQSSYVYPISGVLLQSRCRNRIPWRQADSGRVEQGLGQKGKKRSRGQGLP